MKIRRLAAAVLLTLTVACGATAPRADEPPTLEALRFMVGSWAAELDGVAMEEWWTEPAGGVMLGLHRDVRPGKPAFFEYLRVEATDDGLVYMASPAGREPTPFRLVELDGERVVFANPDHDFPQRIVYWKPDARNLCARAEADREGKTVGSQWCWNRNRAGSIAR